MRDFSAAINARGTRLTFQFRSVYSPGKEKYFVVVKDGGNSLTEFEAIAEHGGKWRITDPAQSWVKDMEAEIVQAITQHNAKESRSNHSDSQRSW